MGLMTDEVNRNLRVISKAYETVVFKIQVANEVSYLNQYLDHQEVTGVSHLPIVKTRGISLAAIEVNIKDKRAKRVCGIK